MNSNMVYGIFCNDQLQSLLKSKEDADKCLRLLSVFESNDESNYCVKTIDVYQSQDEAMKTFFNTSFMKSDEEQSDDEQL